MDLFADLLPLVLQGISILVYLCLVVFFFTKKTSEEKINYLLLVGAILLVIYLSEGGFGDYFYNTTWTFALTQMVIVTLLVVTGTKTILSPLTYVVLLLIYVITFSSHTLWAQLLGSLVYIINSYGFIRAAYDIVTGKS